MTKLKKILISSMLTITGLTLITSNQNISLADTQDSEISLEYKDEISYDSSVYNEEAE